MSFNIYLFIAGIIVFSVVLNTILLKLSENVGIRDAKATIRWSANNKPALGGIGFYTIFLLSFVTYLIVFDDTSASNVRELIGILGAATLAFLMGLADDAYNTNPILKFLVQISCGVILIWSGIYIDLFQSDLANYALSVFWIVAIMNAINLLDNMDAISTVTSSFIILCIIALMISKNYTNTPQFMLVLGVLSSLIGFLFFNWSPSKMFMGDTGSQFLGVFLGALSMQYLWNYEPNLPGAIETRSIFIVLITFSLPIIDTTVVFVNRISRGQSPFVGGKDHTSHNLSYLGMKDSQVGFAYIGISLIGFLMVNYAMFYVDNWTFFHGMIYGLYFILLLTAFFYLTVHNRKQLNDQKKF